MLKTLAAGLAVLVTLTAGCEAFAAQIRGRVVKATCTLPLYGYLSCRTHPYRTTVIITRIEVDGSVSNRRVATDLKGRFRIKVPANQYYVLAALASTPGLDIDPVEITVPPQGVTMTIRVLAD